MKIIGNILGDMRNQLGKKIVAYQWKGIDVFRSYSIPSQPNTQAQITQRNKFKLAVKTLSDVNVSVLRTTMANFAIKKTPFNAAVSKSLINDFDFVKKDKLIISQGPLYIGEITMAQTAENKVSFMWEVETGGNGQDGDKVYCLVYDRSKSSFVGMNLINTRNSGSCDVTVADISRVTDMQAYMCMVQLDGGVVVMVSDTKTKEISSPG